MKPTQPLWLLHYGNQVDSSPEEAKLYISIAEVHFEDTFYLTNIAKNDKEGIVRL